MKKTTFQEIYELQKNKIIGQGAFAQVYIAIHKPSNRQVAVKIVHNYQNNKEKNILFKLLELQKKSTESQLDNYQLHVIQVHDVFEEDAKLFIVQEFCEGGTLYDQMYTKKRINEFEALEIIQQIAKGLLYLASNKIVHRDIKPENVLLKKIEGTQQFIYKITDFGLSNILNQGVSLMQTLKIGTAYYLAPEVIESDGFSNGYDHTIDIWALGLILDEMIFGSPFYNGETEQEVYEKILSIQYLVRNCSEGKQIKVNPLIQELLYGLIQRQPSRRIPLNKALDQIKFILENKWKNFEQVNSTQNLQEIKKNNIESIDMLLSKKEKKQIDELKQNLNNPNVNQINIMTSTIKQNLPITPNQINQLNFKKCLDSGSSNGSLKNVNASTNQSQYFLEEDSNQKTQSFQQFQNNLIVPNNNNKIGKNVLPSNISTQQSYQTNLNQQYSQQNLKQQKRVANCSLHFQPIEFIQDFTFPLCKQCLKEKLKVFSLSDIQSVFENAVCEINKNMPFEQSSELLKDDITQMLNLTLKKLKDQTQEAGLLQLSINQSEMLEEQKKILKQSLERWKDLYESVLNDNNMNEKMKSEKWLQECLGQTERSNSLLIGLQKQRQKILDCAVQQLTSIYRQEMIKMQEKLKNLINDKC